MAKSTRAIYIVNIGTPDYSSVAVESWKYWTTKNKVDLFVLDEPFLDREPHWHKIYVLDLLDEYDRSAVVDNDIVIHPNCPDFFEMVPENKVGVVIDDSNYDWIIRSVEAYGTILKNEFDIFEYFNSGFIVLSKEHRKMYDQVKEFVEDNYDKLNSIQKKYGVGRDQTPLNYLLRQFGAEFHFLSKKFNLQNLPSKEMLDPEVLYERAYIYHYNSIPREVRYSLMEAMWKYAREKANIPN